MPNSEDINVLNSSDTPVVEPPKEQERINVNNIPPKSIGQRELDDTIVTETSTSTLTNKTLTGLILTAGSTTIAPLKLLSGTNLTTPVAGVIEFDGADFYITI